MESIPFKNTPPQGASMHYELIMNEVWKKYEYGWIWLGAGPSEKEISWQVYMYPQLFWNWLIFFLLGMPEQSYQDIPIYSISDNLIREGLKKGKLSTFCG